MDILRYEYSEGQIFRARNILSYGYLLSYGEFFEESTLSYKESEQQIF
jgi:hypothetical protein